MSDSTNLKTPPAGIRAVQTPTIEKRQSSAPSGEPSPRRPGRKPWIVLGGAIVLCVAAVVAYFVANPPGDRPKEISDDEIADLQREAIQAERKKELAAWRTLRKAGLGVSVPIPDSESSPEKRRAAIRALRQRDEELRQSIIGKWDLPKQKKGDYRLVLRDDNTGTLTFTPNLVYRPVLRLWRGAITFTIRWDLKHGHVDMWSISGTPEHAFETAIKHEGRRKYFRLQKATPTRLVLKNVKDGKVDDWRRLD